MTPVIKSQSFENIVTDNRIASYNMYNIVSVGKGANNREHLYTPGGNGVVTKERVYRITASSSNSISCSIPK